MRGKPKRTLCSNLDCQRTDRDDCGKFRVVCRRGCSGCTPRDESRDFQLFKARLVATILKQMPRALSSRQTTANSSSAGSSKRKQLDNGGETPGRQKRLKLIDQTSTTPKNGARRNGLAQTSPTKAQHGRTKSNHSDRTVVDENGQHEDRTTSNVVRFNSLTPTQREWKEMAVYRSFTSKETYVYFLKPY